MDKNTYYSSEHILFTPNRSTLFGVPAISGQKPVKGRATAWPGYNNRLTPQNVTLSLSKSDWFYFVRENIKAQQISI